MADRTYLTPGVYVEELSTLPPSVASVATAIPAFIGCTQKAPPERSDSASPPSPIVVKRIGTMLEYETNFGAAPLVDFTVTTTDRGRPRDLTVTVDQSQTRTYFMYYGLKLYFQNGGGPCYVVSIGDYTVAPTSTQFAAALTALEKEDEPTLILMTDAVNLTDYYETLCPLALAHCAKLQDRFAILDVVSSGEVRKLETDIETFRNGIGTNDLNYGAAYYPDLQTWLPYAYDEERVTVNVSGEAFPGGTASFALSTLKNDQPDLYREVKARLDLERVLLPPSSAIAGIYARVDQDRGVWKAPANESVAGILGPQVRINDADQDGMNVDVTSGKSVNAIREFSGRGTLVWGARTLDGNSSEWRYISVRRLFIFLEESIRKALEAFVFEPNDATTWLKGKAMIDSFLYSLWEQGGLVGAAAKDAYAVDVGLGKTTPPEDALEGRMIFQVLMAPVRPAEFIVLQFMQQLQTA